MRGSGSDKLDSLLLFVKLATYIGQFKRFYSQTIDYSSWHFDALRERLYGQKNGERLLLSI